MTNQHPITPPPELVKQWWKDAQQANYSDGLPCWLNYIATQAARWGADQQLAEDAKWLDQHALDAPHLKITPVGESLKEAMRPKPPSLKEQSIALLDRIQSNKQQWLIEELDVIRRALEALPSD
jgi:hypothetical protein